MTGIGVAGQASWQAKATAKQESILAKIPPQWRLSAADLEQAKSQRDLTGPFIQRFLGPDAISVITMDSVPIVNAIGEGKLTATQVTTASCQTAAAAHQISCLHEIYFDQALERAKFLDDYYAKQGKTVGPLHGLPISLKDQFHVKGVDTTMGYIGWIGSNLGIADPSQAHKVESQVVADRLALGAVPFCKTSVPQTLFMGETKNSLIRQTHNPQIRLSHVEGPLVARVLYRPSAAAHPTGLGDGYWGIR